ncbi:hypothetical protein H2198_001961 [Neophaeococcomyces mojaviensis]|uniref:Uncharacterized protein n=1 Tax=Neophaeococcomyces mojaviensis TaxID=3383035 RepID=A0ACC3AFW9_9EURO|nr:hypothetical protein H2198_001961 [Knufia sp. JES_112]
MASDELRAVLQSLHVPSLILSRSRTINAVNDGICRLTGQLSHKSLVGHKIDEFGFVLIPSGNSQHQDWDSLFQACASEQERPIALQHNDHGNSVDKQRESWVEDFWDDEDRRLSTVVDVMVTRSKSVSIPASEDDVNHIRARMSVRGLRLEGGSMYIITFQRPVLRQELSNAQPRDRASDNEHINQDQNVDEVSLPEDSADREKQVHRMVSTAIPYFTALFDPDGQAVYLSTSWYRVTGMTSEETLGKGWFQAIHPDDRQAMMDGFAKMVRHREDSLTREARYRGENGTYQWFLVRVESSREEFGNLNYWYASMMNVDTLLRTKQDSENRTKSILKLVSHTDVCLWGIQQDGNLLLREGSLSWDPVAILSRQSRKEDSERFNATTCDASTSANRVCDIVKDILDGKLSTYTLEHNEEDRWYRSTLIADLQGHIPNQGSSQVTQAVLGLTIDITDVRARAGLEVQNAALVEKERVAKEASELKSRFVANISHELRTPVAGIIGMNDLLTESLSNKEQRYFSNNIRSAAAQLLNVINDVLDLSKIEAGRLEIESVPFRICQLVENIHSIMAIQAKRKGLSFVCKNVDIPQSIVVVGDPNRLQQVLLNLLSNSIKFTKTGRVTLDVSLVPSTKAAEEPVSRSSDDKETSSQASQPSSTSNSLIEIQFIVEDTGCGMTKATIEKMFEAFLQADSSTARQYGGTGLGLTISRQFVEMMNGTINFESTLGVGTRAVVRITFQKASHEVEEVDLTLSARSPVTAGDVEPGTEAYATLSGVAAEPARQTLARKGSRNLENPASVTATISVDDRNKMLVLIVEDNGVNLKIATLMTEKLGLQVVTALNGEEALDILETRAESKESSPDIILMDCMMPIMDGYEATRRLRQDTSRFSAHSRSIPIIALTASAHEGDMKRCLEAGMDDYLIKPVNKKKLEHALVHWILKGQQRRTQNGRKSSALGRT